MMSFKKAKNLSPMKFNHKATLNREYKDEFFKKNPHLLEFVKVNFIFKIQINSIIFYYRKIMPKSKKMMIIKKIIKRKRKDFKLQRLVREAKSKLRTY